MSAEQLSPAQLATAAEHLIAAKMFSLASCVMLFYDIAITFGDEVEKIWKQRFTGATVLWFLNRYLSPLGYIVIIVSFHDPSWSKAACQRYVLYPEVLKIFTATAVGIIFILRLYSIYSKRNIILYGFGTLLVAELAVKIWAFTDGTMLQLPPGFVGCILTGRSSPGDRIIYTWVAELVFDSVVFFATLYRTITLYRRTLIGEALSLITIIMRDGIMYFAAIFVSNLVTVLIFIFAPPDLKVINASFSTLITSLMVSRLMLNLRAEVLKRGPVIRSVGRGAGVEESYQLTVTTPGDTSRKATFESSIIGNLGAPVITFERVGYEHEYDLYGDEDDDIADGDSLDKPSGRGDGRENDTERSGSLTEFGVRDLPSTHRPGAHQAKKPSLTASFVQTHPLPKFFSKRRPRTAEGRMSHGGGGGAEDNPDHTRSLPGQLVVQVTEEVVVVDEAPDPTCLPSLASPPSVHYPRSPSSPRALSSPSPPPPHAYTRTHMPSSPSSQSPRSPGPPPAYPSRPPHSAGSVYPPPSSLASDSALAPGSPGSRSAYGNGSRTPRIARPTNAVRRSWIPPPSWRLSLDRDREARRPGGHS